MAMKMAVAPSPLSLASFALKRAGINASLSHDPQIADNHMMTIGIARYALTSRRVEILHGCQRQFLLFGRLHDRRAKRMLASPLQARGEPQHVRLRKSCRRLERNHLGLAFRKRPGLVGHNRIDPFKALKRFRVLDEDTGLSAAADPNHDRHRRGEP